MSEALSLESGGGAVMRGYPTRKPDLQEQLQLGYLGAVAAAAGCSILSPTFDDGIDVQLNHKHAAHKGDQVARLEVQLKATSRPPVNKGRYVTTKMRYDRWDHYRCLNPTLNKIVVVMLMPSSQEDWIAAGDEALLVRHCAYWVNIRGAQDSKAKKPVVKAPTSQRFDDVALCSIMERIGQEGRP